MRLGSYRISVEKRASMDPSYYCLTYKPDVSLSKIKQTPRVSRGLHGLGKSGQEWFCVLCFEAMLLLHRQRVQARPPRSGIPLGPVIQCTESRTTSWPRSARSLAVREDSCCALPSTTGVSFGKQGTWELHSRRILSTWPKILLLFSNT